MSTNPSPSIFKSFALFLIALLLLLITAPIGFVYALIRQLIFEKAKTLSLFFIEIALVLDEAGNVVMQHLLNDTLLIKKQNTYYFGNKKETISSVIGKNSLTGTLSTLGKALDAFLNFIDKGHALNSIIYDVKIWEQKNKE
jgi:8-oxo-dGTP diphosphatase